VLAVHFAGEFDRPTSLMSLVIYKVLKRGGFAGVDLFFVLSGFLITRILINTKQEDNYLKSFYMRRVLRIFPLYFVTLILFFLVIPIAHGESIIPFKQQWWYWVYLQNIPMTFGSGETAGPTHFWSLAVEEQFYLIWPFIVLLCNRKTLLRIATVLLLAAPVCRLIVVYYNCSDFYLTPCRIDCLAAGAFVAIYFADHQISRRTMKIALSAAIIATAGIGLCYLLAQRFNQAMVDTVFWYSPECILFTAVLVLVIGSNAGRALARIMSSKPLMLCGKHSYCMYVIHPFLYLYVRQHMGPAGVFGAHAIPEAILDLSLVILLSWLIWHVFEKHFLSLKRYFEAGAKKQSPALTDYEAKSMQA